MSSRLANLLSGDVLLRSPPPFRATEEAWERESLTTHTSSAERLLLRKYGLRRFVDEDSVITIRADALHWDGSKWLCRTFAEDHMLAINDLLGQQIAQATPALPLGLCHAPFALARPDGADAATWRGEAQGNAQRTDEALVPTRTPGPVSGLKSTEKGRTKKSSSCAASGAELIA